MHTRPCLVGPSPEVLDSIRSQLKSRGLTEKDRRLPSIASMLVAQPLGVTGLNEGMFYAKGNCSQFLNSEIRQDRRTQQADQRLERGLSAQLGSINHGG